MLAIYINAIWLPIVGFGSLLLGIILRGSQLKKSKKRVLSLENEMLADHATILKLQKELAALERLNASASSTRVVPMKDSSSEDTQKGIK